MSVTPDDPGSRRRNTPGYPYFLERPHDAADPNPWLALYLDTSVPLDESVKRAWLADCDSGSRQFLLPLTRPFARLLLVLVQLLRALLPGRLHASALLHRLLAWGLRHWVMPTGNWLVLRHFHLSAEILDFIARNTPGVELPQGYDTRLHDLDGVREHAFLRHDLNLFNFLINLNRALREQGRELQPVAKPDFSGITDGEFDIEPMPDFYSNFLDLQTAIELFTPIYRLFATDNDFRRATSALQLDETIASYVSRILDDPLPLLMTNNRHPLAPVSTLRAGSRLVLHGLNTELLHALLVQRKREQAAA